jgi:hypothetical protein
MNTIIDHPWCLKRISKSLAAVLFVSCIVIAAYSQTPPSFEDAEAALKVGATPPFTVLEGEAGILGGGATLRKMQAVPANDLASPELEASGRAFTQLNATGQSVAWINPVDSCNTINIRESIPDAPNGGGIDATLNMYVNGVFRQAIPLNSRQTWVYDGNNGNNNGMSQTPSTGGPHVIYDESRTFITGPALHKGDTVMLKKDADNTASFYYIDCVDFESVAPKDRPDNSLSVADYGATGTGTANCNAAFNSCCNAAKSQGKVVWIPAGKYYMTNWSPNGVTIMGAGMWYTTLYFTMGQVQANACTFEDLCADAVTVQRDQGMGGFNMKGDNWLFDRCWAIHGCWAGYWVCGTNGIIRNCRSSICWGDGLNMNNGCSSGGNNLLAENNFTRGCGDDGATIFSDGGNARIINGAILRNNTSVGMFWANGMRIAGGKNVRAEYNLICDDVKEGGIYIGVYGANGSDLQSATIIGNVVLRCGNQRSPGGISVNAAPGNKVVNVTLANNTIKDAQFYGICIGSSNVTITTQGKNIIDHPAQTAVYVQGGAKGSAYFDSLELVNRIPGKLAYKNDAPSTFSVSFGKHNIGVPDTLPTAIGNAVAGIEKKTDLTIIQSNHSLVINYFASDENGTADVSIYNASGRSVWSSAGKYSHRGLNSISCRTGDWGAGVFVVRIGVTETGGGLRSILSQKVVITNHK